MNVVARFLIQATCVATLTVKAEESEPSYADRMEYLSSVGQYDVSALVSILGDPANCSQMTLSQERSFINEAMNTLRRLYREDAGIEELLIQVAQNDSRDVGVREYALQHMMLLYDVSTHKERIAACLTNTAATPPLDVAALLQLNHLDHTHHVLDRETFADLVLQSANREGLRNADRVTLLALASERQITSILPEVRIWATNSTSRGVMIGSAAFLAGFGSQRDLAVLNHMRPAADHLGVQRQLTTATTRLTQRLTDKEDIPHE